MSAASLQKRLNVEHEIRRMLELPVGFFGRKEMDQRKIWIKYCRIVKFHMQQWQ